MTPVSPTGKSVPADFDPAIWREQFIAHSENQIPPAAVRTGFPVIMPAAGAPRFNEDRIRDVIIKCPCRIPLEIVRCMFPGVVMERFGNLRFPNTT